MIILEIPQFPFEFRAYDKHTNKMIYDIQKLKNFSEFINNKRYVVTQFTGLINYNNDKLFFGDKLKINDPEDPSNGIVIYKYGKVCIQYNYLNKEERFETGIDQFHLDWFDVVGNIYEREIVKVKL
jgi:hypothetical protein